MRSVAIENPEWGELDALERDHPELGRVEVIDGELLAGGVDMTGDRHQSVVQALLLLLAGACPAEHVVRLDTYWFVGPHRLRPDLAIWRTVDRPSDGGAFRRPPTAVIEVLSADAERDLVRKLAIYRSHVVATWFVDPAQRYGWWLSTGDDHWSGDEADITLPGWPSVCADRRLVLEA
jgi:Uma2 family endonuclease